MRKYLKSLQMSKFATYSLDTSTALENVQRAIIKFASKALVTQSADSHKVEFFLSAVAGYDWTTE